VAEWTSEAGDGGSRHASGGAGLGNGEAIKMDVAMNGVSWLRVVGCGRQQQTERRQISGGQLQDRGEPWSAVCAVPVASLVQSAA